MNKKNIILLGITLICLIILSIFVVRGLKSENHPPSSSTTPTVSVDSVSNTHKSNLASVASIYPGKLITWTISEYPRDAGVNINLLRKISDSPITYELVRVIAENTKNDGSEFWQQIETDGQDLYIELTCSTTYKFTQGCAVNGEPFPIL
jgi:hypothetical protein